MSSRRRAPPDFSYELPGAIVCALVASQKAEHGRRAAYSAPRKRRGEFEAHAWVELGGVVLNDGGEGHVHFVPFEGSVVAMETQIH